MGIDGKTPDAGMPDTLIPDRSRARRDSEGPRYLAEILSQMAFSVFRDHEFDQDLPEIPRELFSQGL
ncbi:hypothetical protein NDU88_001202, partial [Pleurodeles waltl]